MGVASHPRPPKAAIFMKTLTVCVLALACAMPVVSAATAAVAQQRGDWVLAPWRGSAQLFPGVVQSNTRGRVAVRFDDGTTETLDDGNVTPFDWRAGTRVECRFTDGRWYPARIQMMGRDGLTMDVLYDDGDRQRTNTGRCRTPA